MYASLLNDIENTLNDNNYYLYIDIIQEINNPFLQHIFYYIVRNYEIGGKIFSGCKKSADTACQYFKKWIVLKRDLFTYGGKCVENDTLWYQYFNILWNKLERDSEYEKWCTIKRDTLPRIPTAFPADLNNPDFNQIIAINKMDKKECKCDPCPQCPSNSIQVKPLALENSTPVQEFSSVTAYSVPVAVGFTLLGTFVTLSFLYKFTNIVSWLYRNQTRKNRQRRYIGEEEEYEFPSSSYENDMTIPKNRRNRISYHSLKN
ncbi:PIR Superfamily Protein [Plasmodium ovale curtisi]|uniref:PIR Superfamily Protein n=1 Tax=Plasmodium ovale curtisi TaxID=864141 RepID=A0A1A8VZG0_PLAOA|nr:PIR Superfamily Protein [Plasmodium ovale curtisi]SBT02015.1 PIR Superfamily Protein [Plasmodium ovale curtisi]